jgi:type IV pilus assembly protein PilE
MMLSAMLCLPVYKKERTVRTRNSRGVTLIELMIVVVIVGILAAIALPSYRNHVVKSARTQAQAELLQLASLQEKIYLNSNSYTANVTTAYTGAAAGGLGRTSGTTNDGKYSLALSGLGTGAQTFLLTATPVAGKSQVGDGNLTISETGQKLWGTANW